MAYVYILTCADGTLYTGWTTAIERRVQEHNAGRGARYTRSRLPVRLAYYEEHADPRSAMRREVAVKRLSRARKLRLIAGQAAGRNSAAADRVLIEDTISIHSTPKGLLTCTPTNP